MKKNQRHAEMKTNSLLYLLLLSIFSPLFLKKKKEQLYHERDNLLQRILMQKEILSLKLTK